MISGYKFIRELGKRGLRGQFFSYEEYKKIGRLNKFENLKAYIKDCGFHDVDNAGNEKELVSIISQQNDREGAKLLALEVLFWVVTSMFGGCS